MLEILFRLLSLPAYLALQKVDSNGYVEIPQGSVQGLVEQDHLIFYNLPYGQAPVGELRFQDPLPATKFQANPYPAFKKSNKHCPANYDFSNNDEDQGCR